MIEALLFQLVLGSVRVIDGDTLHDNERGHDYRLFGVDTPEINGKESCPEELALGEDAAAFVRDAIASASRVEVAPAWDPRGRTRWPMNLNRRLGVVTVDGQNLAGLLIDAGLGVPWTVGAPEHDWCGAAR